MQDSWNQRGLLGYTEGACGGSWPVVCAFSRAAAAVDMTWIVSVAADSRRWSGIADHILLPEMPPWSDCSRLVA